MCLQYLYFVFVLLICGVFFCTFVGVAGTFCQLKQKEEEVSQCLSIARNLDDDEHLTTLVGSQISCWKPTATWLGAGIFRSNSSRPPFYVATTAMLPAFRVSIETTNDARVEERRAVAIIVILEHCRLSAKRFPSLFNKRQQTKLSPWQAPLNCVSVPSKWSCRCQTFWSRLTRLWRHHICLQLLQLLSHVPV